MGPTNADRRPQTATSRLCPWISLPLCRHKGWLFGFDCHRQRNLGIPLPPEMEQQSRQWQHSSLPKPRIFKQAQFAGKVMATVCWDRKGVLLVDFMATGTTINADRYCETLTKLRWAIQNRRRGMLSKGISILYDKARPHASHQTVTLLQRFGWDITHPPYSPDLALSDFHLFLKLKEHLSGLCFNDDDEVKDAVQHFNSMAVNWYDMGIWKLPIHIQQCFDRNGDYVEKWVNVQVWNYVNRIENKHVFTFFKK